MLPHIAQTITAGTPLQIKNLVSFSQQQPNVAFQNITHPKKGILLCSFKYQWCSSIAPGTVLRLWFHVVSGVCLCCFILLFWPLMTLVFLELNTPLLTCNVPSLVPFKHMGPGCFLQFQPLQGPHGTPTPSWSGVLTRLSQGLRMDRAYPIFAIRNGQMPLL